MDKPKPPKTITTRMLGTGPEVEFVLLTDAIAHGEAMAAWGAAQPRGANSVLVPATELAELRAQVEQYRQGHERYETARRMNPQQWKDAWKLNVSTGKPFDEIIDDLRPFMLGSKEI